MCRRLANGLTGRRLGARARRRRRSGQRALRQRRGGALAAGGGWRAAPLRQPRSRTHAHSDNQQLAGSDAAAWARPCRAADMRLAIGPQKGPAYRGPMLFRCVTPGRSGMELCPLTQSVDVAGWWGSLGAPRLNQTTNGGPAKGVNKKNKLPARQPARPPALPPTPSCSSLPLASSCRRLRISWRSFCAKTAFSDSSPPRNFTRPRVL